MLLANPFVPDSRIEDAMAEAAALDLPFDITNTIDDNPFIFGMMGAGSRTGQWVRFHGISAQTLAGDTVEIASGIGLIVGDEFGRVVIAFEDDTLGWTYLGWVTEEHFENVSLHYEASRWTH